MPPTTRRAVYPEGDDGVALKELVEKWRGFVVAAARDTGPNGVTARVVACVLMEEIKGTPHFFESAESRRKTEAEDANEAVQKARAGKKVDPKELNKSMGVGQVKPSTAAAVLDQIPLIEQDRANRAPGRAAAEEKYQNLTVEQKAKLIEMLAQPKSNIEIAAKLLAKLKNRPNRFPDLSREKFGANERAVSIIATEYNLGATTTPEFRAEASDYGKRVWNNMSGDLMYWFFPNI